MTSMNTLRFAQRAKALKTRVKDNTITVVDTDKLLREIEKLTAERDMAELLVRQVCVWRRVAIIVTGCAAKLPSECHRAALSIRRHSD